MTDYHRARRLGLSDAEAQAFARIAGRTPRPYRRFRAWIRRTWLWIGHLLWRLWTLFVVAGALYFAGAMGWSIARLITGDVP